MTLAVETGRLVPQEFQAGDLGSPCAVFADAAVLWRGHAPYAEAQTTAWLRVTMARRRAEGFGEYAVTVRGSGEIIGYCGSEIREIEGEHLPEVDWHGVPHDLWVLDLT